jgi:homoserine O-acetyltransferase
MWTLRCFVLLAAAALGAQQPTLQHPQQPQQQTWPAPAEGDYTARDFRFGTGEVLPELRIHYRTFGKLVRDEKGRAQNAVLILHGTTGSGANFLKPEFAGELFAGGGLLDANRWFLVLPDGIGHGGSSKPSDGLRMRFPRYDYDDMVRAQHLLLTEHLHVDHLRLVLGTSMGGMHTWTWGFRFPDFMDALLPLASLPVAIAGRNRMLRKMAIDSIRGDPQWCSGDYDAPPVQGLTGAIHVLLFMTSSPRQWQREAPTREAAERKLDQLVQDWLRRLDANDALYALDASRNYDPSPHLPEIKAELTAINSADDQVNPPELGILEREIQRVPHGRAVVLPIDDRTRGHGTHSLAALWSAHLRELLLRSTPGSSDPASMAERIWDQREKPASEIWFRRVFELRPPVAWARLVAACDNHCRVFVNGVEVLANDDWTQPSEVDVTKHLISGDNVIAVACKDDGGAAALVLWLEWHAPNESGWLVTDGKWRYSLTNEPGFEQLRHDDRTWLQPALLGKVQIGGNVWSGPPNGSGAGLGIIIKDEEVGAQLKAALEAARRRLQEQGK